MPFPPYPTAPAPVTWTPGQRLAAPLLRSDVLNAVQLLTQPPMFAGAQTGTPQPFTATIGSPAVFTTAVPVAAATPVTLSGSLPGGFTTGTVYWVSGPSVPAPGQPATFQLAATSGGAGLNSTTPGAGTIFTVQQAAAGGWTPVNLDTQVTDPWGGHLLTTSQPYYYGMFAGWYLAEMTAVPAYTGGAGTVSAGITAQEGTGLLATYGGQRVPNSATAGVYPQVTAAKLLQFSATGTYQGIGNNYAAGAVYQDTGTAVTLLATPTRYCQFQLQWVSTLAGNPMLPVPDNDTWPTPPQVARAGFANKNVRDTIAYLAYPPVFEASYAAGTATLAAQASLPAVGTATALDTVYADTYTGWTGTAYRIPRPGVYYLYGQQPVASLTSGQAVAAGLTVTSASYNSGTQFTVWGSLQAAYATAGSVNCAVVRRTMRLAAGDLVSLAGFQANSSSSTVTIPGGTWQPRLIAIWRAK